MPHSALSGQSNKFAGIFSSTRVWQFIYPKLLLPPTVQGLKVCLVWTLEKKSWPWAAISHLTLTELVIAITESPCDQLPLIIWRRESAYYMLALCSMLLHSYYAYFNTSVIRAPLYILLEFLSSTAAHLSPINVMPHYSQIGFLVGQGEDLTN